MGQKVKKVVLENASINTTDYLSGYQYKNDILLFFPTAEGYVNVAVIDTNCITCKPARIISSTTYNYAFNYVDHLGNVRLTYSQDPVTLALRIMEENHYYPFGLKHSGYNSDRRLYTIVDEVTKMRPAPALFSSLYNYKYNGKELQEELGLNLYDFGGRLYMQDIVRTTTLDPMGEKFLSMSPYSFLNNNPLSFIDPTGMEALDYANMNERNGNSEDKIDPPSKKQTAMQRAYNPKTGNTDLSKLVLNAIADVLNGVNTYTKEKIATSDKEITTTATSKNGGGEGDTSKGKKTGDNMDMTGVVESAPALEGANFKDAKSFFEIGKTGLDLFDLGQKLGEGANEIVTKNTNKKENASEKSDYVEVSIGKKTRMIIRSDIYEMQQKQKQNK